MWSHKKYQQNNLMRLGLIDANTQKPFNVRYLKHRDSSRSYNWRSENEEDSVVYLFLMFANIQPKAEPIWTTITTNDTQHMIVYLLDELIVFFFSFHHIMITTILLKFFDTKIKSVLPVVVMLLITANTHYCLHVSSYNQSQSVQALFNELLPNNKQRLVVQNIYIHLF